MKVVFMGTPDYAVEALRAIREAGHEVCAVVTQPDKPKGRGKTLQMSAVKEFALEKGIEVFQPVRVKRPEAVARLASYGADIFVVAAFGQILSGEILKMPRFGCVNIHASLLPRYRGAAPIQWAILNGEKVTGVTIMQMDEGIDTGDMLFKKEVPIMPDDTSASLHDKLARAGAELIVPALEAIEKGQVAPEAQKEEESCYASMISRDMGRIDFSRPAREIERLIRGLNPWPGAYTFYKGKMLKIRGAAVANEKSEGEAGGLMRVEKDAVYVSTGEDVLKITRVQMEGRKEMPVRDFLAGYRMEKGEMLGC